MDQSSQGLLSKLSIQDLPEEKQKEIMAQLDQVVEGRVELALREKLSEEVLKQLDDLVDADKDEEVLDIIKQHIPDYDDMVGKIADDTIDELVNNKDAVMAEVDRLRNTESAGHDSVDTQDGAKQEEAISEAHPAADKAVEPEETVGSRGEIKADSEKDDATEDESQVRLDDTDL